jgi:hypothetical protein
MGSSDERRHKRRAFECLALLDLLDGSMPLRCRVLDISETGARVILGAPEAKIPDELILWLQGKVRRPCRTAWHRNGQIGLQFMKY